MTNLTEEQDKKLDIKSFLLGMIATVLIMGACSLPYFAVTAIGKAWDRQDEGQKAYIERHKLENKGVLR